MPVFHSQLESDALGGETEWAEKDNWPSPSRFTIDGARAGQDPGRLPRAAHDGRRDRAPSSCSASATRTWPSWARSTGRGRSATRWSGIENFLMDVMLDPDKIKRYLDAFLPACIASAQAQFEAGADAVMWADHTTGDLCRAETYRDFLLEMHQHITQEMGGPGIFHCCGKTIDRVAPLRGGRLGRLPLRVAGGRARGARDGRRADGPDRQPQQPDAALPGHARGRLQGVLGPAWTPGVDGLAPEGSVPLVTPEGTADGDQPRPRATGRPSIAATAASSMRPDPSTSTYTGYPGAGLSPTRPSRHAGETTQHGGPEATPDGRRGRRPRDRGRGHPAGHRRGHPARRRSSTR